MEHKRGDGCLHEDRWDEMYRRLDGLENIGLVLTRLSVIVELQQKTSDEQHNTSKEQGKILGDLSSAVEKVVLTIQSINDKVDDTNKRVDAAFKKIETQSVERDANAKIDRTNNVQLSVGKITAAVAIVVAFISGMTAVIVKLLENTR